MDRRQARKEFKARKTLRGVFAVRCTATQEVWVSASGDLNASQTGIWFLLRNGMHHNKGLQASWNAHGAGTFEYRVLENLDEDVSPVLVQGMLRDRQKHWEKELGARMI